MKALILFSCLAFLPTDLIFSNTDTYRIEGIWYDTYDDNALEIQFHRKGIKVREIRRGKRKKWRTYIDMGRGVFDDCSGRALILLDFDRLKWNRRGRGAKILVRGGRSRGFYDDYGSNRYRSNYRGYGGRIDDYCGEWYCAQRGLSLSIEAFGSGLRARSGRSDWVYYDRYGDNDYRDRRGNRYFFDRDGLNWRGRNHRNNFCFTRR